MPCPTRNGSARCSPNWAASRPATRCCSAIPAPTICSARCRGSARGWPPSGAPRGRADGSRCSSTTRATPTRRGCCSARTGCRIAPARPARRDAGRRPHRRARRLRLGRLHAAQGRPPPAAVRRRRVGDDARPRLPHLERRHRGGAGVGPHRRLVLHALPGVGIPRRRRPVGRRPGHAQRGLPVRVRRDPRPHRRHLGRRAASVLRHQPDRAPATW